MISLNAITIERVYQIMRDISHCQQCGQCCTKSDGIELDEHDLALLALRLKKPIPRMLEEHVTQKPGAQIYLLKNVMPCEFLAGSKCTIYDIRPSGCRRYPFDKVDLNNPQIMKREGCAMSKEGFARFKRANAHMRVCRLCNTKSPLHCESGIEILTGEFNDSSDSENRVQTTA